MRCFLPWKFAATKGRQVSGRIEPVQMDAICAALPRDNHGFSSRLSRYSRIRAGIIAEFSHGFQ
jgi:hypothetical protein